MNRKVGAILVAVVLVSAAAGTSRAQEDQYLRTPHRVHIFADVGICIPAQPSEFNKFWNTTLPFTLGAGVPIFAWMDVNGVFSYQKFGNNSLATKERIGVVGTQDVTGGAIKTARIWGSVRFLAVPSARANPYVELGIGAYSTTSDPLVVGDDELINEMEDASGVSYSVGLGLQYALNEGWSTYVKYYFTSNSSDTFAPGDLLLRPGQEPAAEGTDQIYSALIVGLMIRM